MTKNIILRGIIIIAIITMTTPTLAKVKFQVKATEEQKLKMMNPEASKRIKELLKIARAEWPKFKIVLAETYRMQERQNYLYKKGKNTTTVKVSKHTEGLAGDIYFTNGKRILEAEEAPYKELCEIGEGLGLTCGYRWKVPFDPCHFEWNGNK